MGRRKRAKNEEKDIGRKGDKKKGPTLDAEGGEGFPSISLQVHCFVKKGNQGLGKREWQLGMQLYRATQEGGKMFHPNSREEDGHESSQGNQMSRGKNK